MVIAITGIGIVSALGVGQEENRRRLLEAKGGVDKPKHLHTSHHEWPIGEVDKTNEELASMLGLGDVTYTRNILLGLLAIREAMSDSAIHEAEWGGTPASGTCRLSTSRATRSGQTCATASTASTRHYL